MKMHQDDVDFSVALRQTIFRFYTYHTSTGKSWCSNTVMHTDSVLRRRKSTRDLVVFGR